MINSKFLNITTVDELFSVISDYTGVYTTCTAYVYSDVVKFLTNDESETLGKGLICPLTDDIADILLLIEGGKQLISGRLTLSTRSFEHYTQYMTKNELDPFMYYRKDVHATSVKLVVPAGVYFCIGYVYSYSVLSREPIVAIVGSADEYADSVQHKSLHVLHESDFVNLSVHVTTNTSKVMTVTMARNDNEIEHFYLSLMKLK